MKQGRKKNVGDKKEDKLGAIGTVNVTSNVVFGELPYGYVMIDDLHLLCK